MELTALLGLFAAVLPLAYGAPTETLSRLQPEVLAAMKRDLGLETKAAEARVSRELASHDVIKQLRDTVGEAFAGAWLTDDAKTINIAITDKASIDAVIKAGGHPVVHTNSMSKLEKAMEALNELERTKLKSRSDGHSGVASWYVDVIANKIVLEAIAEANTTAEEMAQKVGLEKSEFEVHEVAELPNTKAAVVGGEAYIINGNTRCSIGFSVNNGFITAGHCGGSGAQATTSSGEYLGNVADSEFPGSDMAHVNTVGGTVLSPYIQGYGNYTPGVRGSNVAPTGASICHSGSTTGLRCGTVTQSGVTVNYPQGLTYGLTGTNACCEGGDSGGSFFAGNQAQGVTSGGSGNCRDGGVTFFQPVNPILSRYGLALIFET